MENAAKALIMAGGILIGLLVFAMFVYEMTAFASHSRIYEEKVAQQQTMEFNSQFEKYLSHDITAQDVVTIYNLTVQWNNGHPDDDVTIHWGANELKSKIESDISDFLAKYNENQFKCEIKSESGIEPYDKWGRVRHLYISKKA